MSFATLSGARIPHVGGGNTDPYFSDVIFLAGMGDFADHSPLNLGTATPTHETVDAANPLGGVSSIACDGMSGQSAQWSSSGPLVIPVPCIFEAWFKCASTGDGNTHPVVNGRNSSNRGPFLFLVGLNSQWSVSNHDGSNLLSAPARAFTPDVWNYCALLVDNAAQMVAHIGLQGGMTTPTAVATSDSVGLLLGPHWALGGNTTDLPIFSPYLGNYAGVRVTKNTTRGHTVASGGVGVSYAVPTPPWPLS